MINKKKKIFGQYFTKDKTWLKPQIVEFIKSSNCDTAYDPFAGNGDLLNSAKELGFKHIVGLDIDPILGWQKNDSLNKIPKINSKTIIITNPPYLSNYSASRKGIYDSVKKYFKNSNYDDLYLIALNNMIKAQKNIVAIVPESFINSNFKDKDLLTSITILEDNPFNDTTTPVIVACFNGKKKSLSKVLIYKNEKIINNLQAINNLRLNPKKTVKITFNDANGWLAVRCVDSTNPNHALKFDYKDNILYDWNNRIKISSRLYTLINITIENNRQQEFIDECNKILQNLREKTDDIILSPFKGNMKNGKRRRRLDYKTCRAIVELAYENIIGFKQKEKKVDNLAYFNYSKNNPENLNDPYYERKMVVLPPSISLDNLLTKNYKRMIDLITTFKVLISQDIKSNSLTINAIIDEIDEIMLKTPNINYTPFSQFFMVYNHTYSQFRQFDKTKRKNFIFEMLVKYCEERHDLYLSHGYTNSILQVICDSYSHKRNSKTTINKVLAILAPLSLIHIKSIEETDLDNFYFLPDKGNKKLFDSFLEKFKLDMKSREIEHGKYPDIVFKHNDNYYICELKTMKGIGGGQSKQIVEINNFIDYSETFSNFHYITFLDNEYANTIFNSNAPRITKQRERIEISLKNNPKNFFLNTAGLSKFIEDIT